MALQGFDKEYFLPQALAKLQQLTDYADMFRGQNVAYLEDMLAANNMTAESFYENWGWKYDMSPNQFFDKEYYISALSKWAVDNNYYATETAARAAVMEAWAGKDFYQHYLEYGSKSDINPSAAFDESSYIDNLYTWAQTNAADALTELGINNAADLHTFFNDNNVSALGNYMDYGRFAGVAATPVHENDAPVAVDQAVETGQEHVVTGKFSATDVDTGDTLTFAITDNPMNGTVVNNGDGTFTYTPDAHVYGHDKFEYSVSDGNGGTDTAFVSVTILATPDANPVAVTGNEDAAAINGSFDASDYDTPDADLVYAISTDVDAAKGTVTNNGDGTFTFVPVANWNGTAEFEYTVTDGTTTSDPATVTVTVNPVNDPPTLKDDMTATVTAGNSVTLKFDNYAFDPDGDALTYAIKTTAANGTLTNNGDGTVTYTPNAGQSADDTFTFTASDGTDTIDATVSIDVNNNAPVAVDDSTLTAISGQLTTFDLLANDTDGDDDATQTLTITKVDQPAAGGVVEINGTKVNFTSSPGYAGEVTFTYTISDGFGGTDTATATVNVKTQLGGTDGNDYLSGSNNPETLEGAAGNDTIDGGGGADAIDGGTGNDIITWRGSESAVTGNLGVDTLLIPGTNSKVGSYYHINFTKGGNQVVTTAGFGTKQPITGFENLDASGSSVALTVTGATTTTSIITGGGADTITLTNGGSVTVDAKTGNDTVTGSTGADTIYGGAGNDSITGSGGVDVISGDDGDDTIDASASTGIVTIDGGAGNDSVYVSATSLVAGTVLKGGDGTADALAYKGATAITLAATAFSGGAITGFEILSSGTTSTTDITVNDTTFTNLGVTTLTIKDTDNTAAGTLKVTGSSLSAANSLIIYANGEGAGNAAIADSLYGGAGNDTFIFSSATDGAGADGSVIGLDASDVIQGGAGTDTLQVILKTNNMTAVTLPVDVTGLEKIVAGNDSTDTNPRTAAITTDDANFDTVTGGAVIDATGMVGAFTFNGIEEDDTVFSIKGGAGADILTGSAMTTTGDTIDGGAGNDTITVTVGVDSLVGGAGDDIFSVTTLANLQSSPDKLVGGDGTDTLKFSDAIVPTIVAADLAGLSSVEQILFANTGASSLTLADSVFTANGLTSLTIQDTDNTAALTVNAAALASVNSIIVDDTVASSDSLVGGAGNDTFKFTTTNSATVLDNNDTITGGTGTDTLQVVLDVKRLTAVTLDGDVTQIESIVVGYKTGGLTTLNASISLNDANFATITGAVINASGMTGTGTFTFDASSEDDSTFSITGGAGADTITGGATTTAGDTIDAGAGADTIVITAGVDSLVGGAGDDIFSVTTLANLQSSPDKLLGGAGTDTLKFSGAIVPTIVAADLAGLSSVEQILFANTGASSLTLADSVFTANGLTSLTIQDTTDNTAALTVNAASLTSLNSIIVDDTVASNDSLVGGAGNDTFKFTTTNSATVLDNNDTITGGAGTDILQVVLDVNSLTAVTLDGDVTQIESIVVGYKIGGLTTLNASITLNDANFDTITGAVINASGMEGTGTFTFNAGTEDDSSFVITGGAGADTITGGVLADTIDAGAGSDSIFGGTGNDSIIGGAGNDTIDGGSGDDIMSGGIGNDYITMSQGNDQLDGGSETTGTDNDVLVLSNPLTGSTTVVDFSVAAGSDQVTQFAGVVNATLQTNFTHLDASALQGSLVFTGSSVAESVTGGTGGDQIDAGAGNDTICGGDNGDQLTGNSGADYFVYRAATDGADAGSILSGTYDTITDFVVGTDKIAFGSTLYTALDDNPNSALAVGTSGVKIDATAQEVFVSTVSVTDAQLKEAGFTTLIANVFGTMTNDAAGGEFVIVVHGSTQSGIYLFQAADADHAAAASEITLLGVVTNSAAVTTTDIVTTTV